MFSLYVFHCPCVQGKDPTTQLLALSHCLNSRMYGHGKESNENLELDESIKHGEQITDVDTDTFSITCSSSSITPLKRSIPDNDRGEDLSVDTVPAQHSCSKMKKIKIEKEDV
ncbi:hypothetical protein Taro_049707 [Colocasia esculenta]|uniref:Uncharacterized protein n=1 Tax=Colocasia esculenta TaxID=4460 RepID=A0A843XBL0_COLES|nr:hypothetical protein [Colocasia esculenta]